MEGALLNCGIAREKINQPEHTADRSQNKGTEKLQRRAGPCPLEVGGSGEGTGANSAPEKPPPPTQQTGPRFLSKELLRPDQQHVLGPRREKARRTQGEGAQASGCLSHSPWREKASCIRGKCAEASGCLNCSGRGSHKTQAQPNPRFCEVPETGTALNAGPAPYKAAGSLNSVDGESTDTPVRGKPSVTGTRGVLATHSDICLQRSALPIAGLN